MKHTIVVILYGAGAILAVFGLTGPAIACISAGLFVSSL